MHYYALGVPRFANHDVLAEMHCMLFSDFVENLKNCHFWVLNFLSPKSVDFLFQNFQCLRNAVNLLGLWHCVIFAFHILSFKLLFYRGLRANWKLGISSLKIYLLINILSLIQSSCLLTSCCSCLAYSSQFSFVKNFPSNLLFKHPYSTKSFCSDLLLVTHAFLQAFEIFCVVWR